MVKVADPVAIVCDVLDVAAYPLPFVPLVPFVPFVPFAPAAPVAPVGPVAPVAPDVSSSASRLLQEELISGLRRAVLHGVCQLELLGASPIVHRGWPLSSCSRLPAKLALPAPSHPSRPWRPGARWIP